MSEDTYAGRRARIASILDPSTVFVSDEDIELAKEVVRSKKPHSTLSYSSALKIHSGCVHPQTSSTIFTPLRISWILPSNVLCTTFMIMASGAGSKNLITASQIMNQTYNTAHYYANRNTSNPDSNLKIGLSYIAAVSSSILTSTSLENFARKSSNPSLFRMFNPFVAVAVGTSVNMGCMRSSEIFVGVEVFEGGESRGVNLQAGRIGVGVSILGRILTAFAPLTVPQLISGYLNRSLFKSLPMLHTPVYVGCLAGVIQVTTPWTLGAFRQRYEVEKSEVGIEGEGRVEWNRGM
ncbi:hypothetical protein TrST_g9927 [Triparma strigata]|uniref:Uncharacterized protein n=1 Tax=Triparma strigata TaxID=1606541 RepID=A0A9W7E5K3_9STRA|nr:hypothetical protein TrST_g9927 [Triparma strigata]